MPKIQIPILPGSVFFCPACNSFHQPPGDDSLCPDCEHAVLVPVLEAAYDNGSLSVYHSAIVTNPDNRYTAEYHFDLEN